MLRLQIYWQIYLSMEKIALWSIDDVLHCEYKYIRKHRKSATVRTGW